MRFERSEEPLPSIPESLRAKLNTVVDEFARERGMTRDQALGHVLGFVTLRGIPETVDN